jgi:hypothetical protein
MELSPLNNIIKDVKKKLYHRKYSYRATVHKEGSFFTRYCTTVHHLRKLVENSKNTGFAFKYTSVIDANMPYLEAFVLWKNKVKGEVAIRVEYTNIFVYSNNISLLSELINLTDSPTNIDIHQAIIEGDEDVIKLARPKHKFRVYIKGRYTGGQPNVREEIARFLNTYKNIVYPCGAFLHWVNESGIYTTAWRQRNLSSHFYIEYDHESTSSIIGLNLGEYMGKTYKIEQR